MDREQVKAEYLRRSREKALEYATKNPGMTDKAMRAYLQGFLDGWSSCTDIFKEASK